MLFFHTWIRRLIYPFWALGMLWRLLLSRGARACGSGRLGVPPAGEGEGLWFHAETPADVQTAAPLVRQLVESRREGAITFTTAGPDGLAEVAALFGHEELVTATCAPLDLPGSVGRFIRRLQPRALVVVAGVTRPNMVRRAHRRRLPVMLLNATELPRRRGGARRAVKWLDAVTTVDEASAELFRPRLADAEAVTVTGDIRFDAPAPGAGHKKQAEELREDWGDKRPVWLAFDVEAKEATMVRDALTALRRNHHNLVLVLVPAQPGQGTAVEAPFSEEGYTVVRHGGGQKPGLETEVYVIDSVRDRPLACALADVAFVGGSLVGAGHNPAPVAAAGRPVVSGPNLHNVAAVASALHSVHAQLVVGSPKHLSEGLEKLFEDRDKAQQLGAAGQQLITPHSGSIRKAEETLAWLARGADDD